MSQLQNLETKVKNNETESSRLQQHHQQPGSSRTLPSVSVIHPSAHGSEYASYTLPTSSAAQPTTFGTLPSDVPHAQRPYQIQTLADLRSGSLPPHDDNGNELRTRRRDEDSGAKTEPDTEDTTDYSSSDQYEREDIGRKTIDPNFHYNLLLSNPQIMNNLPSFLYAEPTTSHSLTSVQPTLMPNQRDSSKEPKQHPPVQHQHTHPKLNLEKTEDPTRLSSPKVSPYKVLTVSVNFLGNSEKVYSQKRCGPSRTTKLCAPELNP